MSGSLLYRLFDVSVLNGLIDHAEKLHQLPDEYLADMLPIAKKIAVAQGAENYNILQVGNAAFLSAHAPSTPLCAWGLFVSELTIFAS
jgi:hypothetical protein